MLTPILSWFWTCNGRGYPWPGGGSGFAVAVSSQSGQLELSLPLLQPGWLFRFLLGFLLGGTCDSGLHWGAMGEGRYAGRVRLVGTTAMFGDIPSFFDKFRDFFFLLVLSHPWRGCVLAALRLGSRRRGRLSKLVQPRRYVLILLVFLRLLILEVCKRPIAP